FNIAGPMLGLKSNVAERSSMPRSTFSASARLSPRVYSGNGCVEIRMAATSYPAVWTAWRTWLRNLTVSSIWDGSDFASIVMKPVIARTFGFGRSTAGDANEAARISTVRTDFGGGTMIQLTPLS